MIGQIVEIVKNPAKEVARMKKKADLNEPLKLLLFTALLLLVGFLVQNLQNLGAEMAVGGIVAAIVIVAFISVYAYFIKVPFEILTANSKDSYYKSLSSVVLGMAVFSVGYVIYSVLVLLASLLAGTLLPLSVIMVLLGLAVVLYYSLMAVSTTIKAYIELFKTDLLTVLVIVLVILGYALIIVEMVGMATLLTSLVTSIESLLTQPVF